MDNALGYMHLSLPKSISLSLAGLPWPSDGDTEQASAQRHCLGTPVTAIWPR